MTARRYPGARRKAAIVIEAGSLRGDGGPTVSQGGRGRARDHVLFVIAFGASVIFILAIVLSSLKLQPSTYEMTGSSSRPVDR